MKSSPICHAPRYHGHPLVIHHAPMAKHPLGKHFIKEWRRHRRLSLRKLEGRLEIEPGGEPLVSFVSLGRIENGKQPYSQPILEALSVALNCSVSDLLSVDPSKDGDVIDMIRRMSDSEREEIRRYAEFVAAKRA